MRSCLDILSRSANSHRRPYSGQVFQVLKTGSRCRNVGDVFWESEEFQTGLLVSYCLLCSGLGWATYETPTGAAESCLLALAGGDAGTLKVTARVLAAWLRSQTVGRCESILAEVALMSASHGVDLLRSLYSKLLRQSYDACVTHTSSVLGTSYPHPIHGVNTGQPHGGR
jgi:hypothetical protein